MFDAEKPSPLIRALAWTPSVVLMAVVTYLSSQTRLGVSMGIPHQDKVMHFIAYAALGATAAFALRVNHPAWTAARLVAVGTLVAALFGVSDELHQAFVPGRDASLADFFADFLGAMTGAWVVSRVERLSLGRAVFGRIFAAGSKAN